MTKLITSKLKRPRIESLLQKEFAWEAREDRVVIYPDEQTHISKGGLHIPQSALGKPSKGIVIEVGPGMPGRPTTDLSRGDHVIYGRFAGVDIESDDVEYVVVRQSDIILREKKSPGS